MVNPHKIFWKGEESDFVVFVEDLESLENFRNDSTVPLVDVVSVFKVWTTRNRGAEGELLQASKHELENEFGKLKEDEIIKKIILEGADKLNASVQSGHNAHNDSMGPAAISNYGA